MKIGLYFGSFNPIHIGHIHVAKQALSQCNLDEVWLMVSPQNPFKEADDLAPEKDRLAMAQIACEATPGIRVSDFEFSLPRPSFTITTLKMLRNEFQHFNFYIIIGEDNLNSLHRWKDIDKLLQIAEVIVYPRSGEVNEFPVELLSFKHRFHRLTGNHIDVSATEIRSRLKAGQLAEAGLHSGVLNYIRGHHLYGS